jgi:hypothetical protein
MHSKSILFKAESFNDIFNFVLDEFWISTSGVENIVLLPVWIDPCCDWVNPVRDIISQLHWSVFGPFGVRKHPVSVDLGGVIPITSIDWNDDWPFWLVRVKTLICVWSYCDNVKLSNLSSWRFIILEWKRKLLVVGSWVMATNVNTYGFDFIVWQHLRSINSWKLHRLEIHPKCRRFPNNTKSLIVQSSRLTVNIKASQPNIPLA